MLELKKVFLYFCVHSPININPPRLKINSVWRARESNLINQFNHTESAEIVRMRWWGGVSRLLNPSNFYQAKLNCFSLKF